MTCRAPPALRLMSTPEYRVKLADIKDWQRERRVGETTYESKPREQTKGGTYGDHANDALQKRQGGGNDQERQECEDNLRETWRRISSPVPVPYRRMGRRVVGCFALCQLGSVWQGAGGISQGS